MRPILISRALAADDADGICQSQAAAGAAPLVLNGAFVSGGVATLDVQRRVLITSVANESGITFMVTGTDDQNREISEVIAGPNATTAQSLLDFKTVTAAETSGATTGNVTVGTSAVGSTKPIPLDQYISPFNVTLPLDITGVVDVTVQYTFDDVFEDGNYGPFTWFDHSSLTNIAADAEATLVSPVAACRLLTNSGVGTAVMRVLQAGLT